MYHLLWLEKPIRVNPLSACWVMVDNVSGDLFLLLGED